MSTVPPMPLPPIPVNCTRPSSIAAIASGAATGTGPAEITAGVAATALPAKATAKTAAAKTAVPLSLPGIRLSLAATRRVVTPEYDRAHAPTDQNGPHRTHRAGDLDR